MTNDQNQIPNPATDKAKMMGCECTDPDPYYPRGVLSFGVNVKCPLHGWQNRKPLVDPAVTLADQFRLLAHAADTGTTVYRSDGRSGLAAEWAYAGGAVAGLGDSTLSLVPPRKHPPVEVGQVYCDSQHTYKALYVVRKFNSGYALSRLADGVDFIRGSFQNINDIFGSHRDDFTLMKLVPDEEKP